MLRINWKVLSVAAVLLALCLLPSVASAGYRWGGGGGYYRGGGQ